MRRPALSESVAKYRSAMTRADVRAGEVLGKAPGVGRIFEEEMRTPVKSVGSLEVTHVQKVKRLTAPLVKAQKFLVPLFAYEGLRRIAGSGGSEKAAGDKTMTMTRDEQVVLLKAANLIDELKRENEVLVEKLARVMHEQEASKLAGVMAQKGIIPQEELEKKASELAKEDDLRVVKKAVDMAASGMFDLGKVEKKASTEGAEDSEELDPMTASLVDWIQNNR